MNPDLVNPAPANPGPVPADELYDVGMRVCREVLGDEHVDQAIGRITEFSRPFQDYITRAAWGSVWAGGGLDRRTRSAVTLAALTAPRCHEELASHVRVAIHNGLTAAEIGEIILHTGIYAGAPAGNATTAIARRVLAALGEPAAQPPTAG